MMKTGSKRRSRYVMTLYAMLCAGLFLGCGGKKSDEVDVGSIAAEKETQTLHDGREAQEIASWENMDYGEAFEGLNGCAVVFEPQEQVCRFYNKSLCETEASPCSTFKIVSALMGLKYHVLEDENSTVGYDGKQYGNSAWNQDLSLKDAFRFSCVWYFRKVIDQVGQERVKEELTALNYGNCDISEWEGSGINPGEELNGFWLSSSLKISPYEQVRILSDIFEGHSGFAEEQVQILKNIMASDESGLYGKTGTGANGQAWFVGFSEEGERRKYFAVFLDDPENKELVSGKKARETAIKIIGRQADKLNL